MRLDVRYVENWSLGLDLTILWSGRCVRWSRVPAPTDAPGAAARPPARGRPGCRHETTADSTLAAGTWRPRFAGGPPRSPVRLLTDVRRRGLAGGPVRTPGRRRPAVSICAEHRPADAVLSEEGRRARRPRAGSGADRVWIIDPLDGTREFSEPPRDDWAVHVALWEDGELVAGAVAQPGLGPTFDTGHPPRAAARPPGGRASPSAAPARRRSWRPWPSEIGADLVPMGSAGAKVISVVRGAATPTCTPAGSTSGTPPRRWPSPAPPGCTPAARRLAAASTTRPTCAARTWWSAVPSWPTRSWSTSRATASSDRPTVLWDADGVLQRVPGRLGGVDAPRARGPGRRRRRFLVRGGRRGAARADRRRPLARRTAGAAGALGDRGHLRRPGAHLADDRAGAGSQGLVRGCAPTGSAATWPPTRTYAGRQHITSTSGTTSCSTAPSTPTSSASRSPSRRTSRRSWTGSTCRPTRCSSSTTTPPTWRRPARSASPPSVWYYREELGSLRDHLARHGLPVEG